MTSQFDSQIVAFDPAQGLALLDNTVDVAAGTISGVSLATAGVQAIGHGEYSETGEVLREFWTDQTTLETMLEACNNIGQPLKAKMEHGTGLSEVVGTFDNFRIDGDHLRADFTSINTSAGVAHLFSLATRISTQFGVSVTAGLRKLSQGGVDLMRCVDIKSADFVDSPAINAGLFSAKSAPPKISRLSKKPIKNMEEEDVKTLLAEGLKPLAAQLSALVEAMPKAKTDEELASDEKKDEELAAKDAEKATKEEAKEAAKEAELSALKLQITSLSAKVVLATNESKQLGVKFGARLQTEVEREAVSVTFAAEMSTRQGEGKPYHVALMELQESNPKMVQNEADRLGVRVTQL